MPDRDKKHGESEDQGKERETTNSPDATRQRQDQVTLDKVEDALKEGHIQERLRASQEERELGNRQAVLLRELKAMQEAELKATAPEAQPGKEREQQRELEEVQRFQEDQRQRLEDRAGLEARVAKEQDEALRGMGERHGLEREAVAQRSNLDEATRASQVEELRAQQEQQFQALVDTMQQQGQALEAFRETQQRDMQRDERALQDLVYDRRNEPDREEKLAEHVDGCAEDRHRALRETQDHLNYLEQQQSRIQDHLNDDQVRRLQDRLEQALGVRLEAEAVQRVAREATRGMEEKGEATDPGRSNRQQAAEQRTKGQLFEELAFRALQKLVEDENARRPQDKQLEVIHGERIRDADNRKLTDGLTAIRDQARREISEVTFFEAKAGAEAARELDNKKHRLSEDDRRELEKYARDLARDEVLGLHQGMEETAREYAERQADRMKNLTQDEEKRVQELTARRAEDLRSNRVQVERGGQMRQTIERLHEDVDRATRLRIDGQWYTKAKDEGVSPGVKVLPRDVAKRQDALRVDVTRDQLEKAVKVAMEEASRVADERRALGRECGRISAERQLRREESPVEAAGTLDRLDTMGRRAMLEEAVKNALLLAADQVADRWQVEDFINRNQGNREAMLDFYSRVGWENVTQLRGKIDQEAFDRVHLVRDRAVREAFLEVKDLIREKYNVQLAEAAVGSARPGAVDNKKALSDIDLSIRLEEGSGVPGPRRLWLEMEGMRLMQEKLEKLTPTPGRDMDVNVYMHPTPLPLEPGGAAASRVERYASLMDAFEARLGFGRNTDAWRAFCSRAMEVARAEGRTEAVAERLAMADQKFNNLQERLARVREQLVNEKVATVHVEALAEQSVRRDMEAEAQAFLEENADLLMDTTRGEDPRAEFNIRMLELRALWPEAYVSTPAAILGAATTKEVPDLTARMDKGDFARAQVSQARFIMEWLLKDVDLLTQARKARKYQARDLELLKNSLDWELAAQPMVGRDILAEQLEVLKEMKKANTPEEGWRTWVERNEGSEEVAQRRMREELDHLRHQTEEFLAYYFLRE